MGRTAGLILALALAGILAVALWVQVVRVRVADARARSAVHDAQEACREAARERAYALEQAERAVEDLRRRLESLSAAKAEKEPPQRPTPERAKVQPPPDPTLWLPGGWCRALPGSITGTPVPADLDGDGDLEIVVPCMDRRRYAGEGKLVHPEPENAAKLYAFHHDGRPVEGWPVVVQNRLQREAMRAERRGYSEDWACSPSIADLDGDGKDDVVVTVTGGGLRVFAGNGIPFEFEDRPGGDPWASIPLVDVDGDGVNDFIAGWLHINAHGGNVPGWPRDRMLKGGFAPCVGDANGDGHLEFYHPFYADASTIGGFDCHGNPLPGWPQKVGRQCLFAPVMGDVDGDGKMEVCAGDQHSKLHLWTWDGKPLPATRPDGAFTSVFKTGVGASMASPTLADLDGDGAAEIIVFDTTSKTLYAWRANGRGLFNDDGAIVRLPDAKCWGGVTVGDLGGDGVMGLFVATYWIRLSKDGSVKVTNMLADPHWAQPSRDGSIAASNILTDTAPTTTACTIADIDRDGKAEILFGLTDGRLIIYRTDGTYRSEWVEWATANANVRHTGSWLPRDKRPRETPRRGPVGEF